MVKKYQYNDISVIRKTIEITHKLDIIQDILLKRVEQVFQVTQNHAQYVQD